MVDWGVDNSKQNIHAKITRHMVKNIFTRTSTQKCSMLFLTSEEKNIFRPPIECDPTTVVCHRDAPKHASNHTKASLDDSLSFATGNNLEYKSDITLSKQ